MLIEAEAFEDIVFSSVTFEVCDGWFAAEEHGAADAESVFFPENAAQDLKDFRQKYLWRESQN